jgi:hypothetical protein
LFFQHYFCIDWLFNSCMQVFKQYHVFLAAIMQWDVFWHSPEQVFNTFTAYWIGWRGRAVFLLTVDSQCMIKCILNIRAMTKKWHVSMHALISFLSYVHCISLIAFVTDSLFAGPAILTLHDCCIWENLGNDMISILLINSDLDKCTIYIVLSIL